MGRELRLAVLRAAGASLLSLTLAVIRNGAVRLFLKEISKEKFLCFFAQRRTEGGCCSSSSIERRCNFVDRVWGKSDISPLRKGKRNAIVRMLKQIEEMKEVRILPSFCKQRKKCFCWLRKRNTSRFQMTMQDFLMQTFMQNILQNEASPLKNCVGLIVVYECQTV